MFDAHDDARFNSGTVRSRIGVPGIALDAYLEQHGAKANRIKIDIQGAEIMALPGMMKTLAHPETIVFFECWPYGLRQTGGDPRTLLEINETSRKLSPVDLAELSERYPDLGLANLISAGPQAAAGSLGLARGLAP